MKAFGIAVGIVCVPSPGEDAAAARVKLHCTQEEIEAAVEQIMKRKFPHWTFEIVDTEPEEL